MHSFMLDVVPIIVTAGVLVGSWLISIIAVYFTVGFAEENRRNKNV